MKIEISDEELVLLDGKVGQELQSKIELSKSRIASKLANADLPEPLAKFIADVVQEALTNGELVHQHNNIRYCSLCGKSAGYAVHKRSGRYHRRGTPNHDRPLTMSGVELANRFFVMKGHSSLGCCNTCFDQLKPALAKALKTVKAQIPESLTGTPSKYARHNRKQCKCGWVGHEGEMGKLRTLMGDGWYPGKCPKCGAENLFLGPQNINTIEGFELVENKPTKGVSV